MIKGGYQGNILRVNLSRGEIKTESINKNWAKDFIGGRGYGTRLIFEEVDPVIDPLSEENKVVVATGPLTGTICPSSSRTTVITKGALNSAIACSNAGGYFGPELKYAGFDAIVIEGKAKEPVYLWIYNGKVELRSAKNVWGKLVGEADTILRAKTHTEAKTMLIGPAGEKLSKIANVMFDRYRAAGRTGVGAVVGSKNLKAVVVKGSMELAVADPETFKSLFFEVLEELKKDPLTKKRAMYGTNLYMGIYNPVGGIPTRNAQDAYFTEAERIDGKALREKILLRNVSCASCPGGCGRATEIKEGKYKGARGGGPEYETAYSCGIMCAVSDLNAIAMAGYLCDDYGIDTISAGCTVACAMELYERGYIPQEDAPFPLVFESGDALVEAVKLMGEQKGKLGKLLAEGSYRLAEHYGHPELSMSVKKQEFPGYDPRAFKGMGLGYATSNRGACHVRGFTAGAEKREDRFAFREKAKLLKPIQDFVSALDSCGCCLFTRSGVKKGGYATLLLAATGIQHDNESFLKAGERIWNLERLFNLRAGFTRKDDTLPLRMLKEPVKTGPSKGQVVAEFDRMLDEYYEVRGWDKDGVPTEEKLKELGIEHLK